MASRLNLNKQLPALRKRYKAASRKEKGQILKELEKLTGYATTENISLPCSVLPDYGSAAANAHAAPDIAKRQYKCWQRYGGALGSYPQNGYMHSCRYCCRLRQNKSHRARRK